jgi:hypothetical protein
MKKLIDFRDAIKKRMAELGINSGYALAKVIEHKITTTAIDNFLSGRSSMTAQNLEILLNALGGRLSFKKP